MSNSFLSFFEKNRTNKKGYLKFLNYTQYKSTINDINYFSFRGTDNSFKFTEVRIPRIRFKPGYQRL